jgi:hypothetical protein
MLLGIGLFSAINATLTSFMLANESEAPASAADRLRELADRYRSGLLTDDEYESKRSDAIARL